MDDADFDYPFPLLIIAGKGGVGKTVLTATVGSAAVKRGHSTLVVELGGQRQLPRLLTADGGAAIDGDSGDDDGVVALESGLDWVSLSPERLLAGWLSGRNMGLIASRLESSGALEVISSSIPGIKDALVLGKLRSWVDAGRWDRIVVDGPASGRAREMLRAPQLLAEAATDGPIASQGTNAHELLVDETRSAVLLVTLPEETPVTETIETAFDIEDDPGVALAGLVVNRVFPTTAPPKRRKHPAYDLLADRWQTLVAARSRLDDQLPIRRSELRELAEGVSDRGDIDALLDGKPEPPDSPDSPSEKARSDGEATSPSESALYALHDKQIVVTVGTGGVGKTSVAAALAVDAAMDGRRVALITIDPARRLADALGLDDLGDDVRSIELGEAADPATVGELGATMLDPQETFARVVTANAATDEQASAILDSPLSSQLAESLSGMTEYMAVERLWELQNLEEYDLIVVDTPPSSDALAFLDAPELLARLLDNRIYRLLVHDGRKGVINRALGGLVSQLISVVGGAVVRDAVAFFKGFNGMEEGFRERGQEIHGQLRGAETGFVLVVAPTESSLANATTFAEQLRTEGIDPALTIVNRRTPSFDTLTGNDEFDAMVQHLRARREAEQRSIAEMNSATPTTHLDELGAGITSLEDVVELARDLHAGAHQLES